VRLSARLARGLLIFGEMDWPHYHAPELQPGGSWLTTTGGLRCPVGLTIEEERLGVTAAGMATGALASRTAPVLPRRLVHAAHLPRATCTAVGQLLRGGVRVSDLAADRNFLALVVRLRQLGDDPAVAGVLLDIEEPELGLGRIEELRALVADLRQRKPCSRVSPTRYRATYWPALVIACSSIQRWV